MHMERRLPLFAVLLAIISLFGCGPKTATAPSPVPGQDLVNEAEAVFREQLEGERGDRLRQFLADAKGVLIMPRIGSASFIVSVGGGKGILLARTGKGWAGPVFLSKAEAGIGLQAGVTSDTAVFLFTNERDVRFLLDTGLIVRGNADLVMLDGDVEFDRTADFPTTSQVLYSGSKEGLYLGIGVSGGGMRNLVDVNASYNGVEGGDPSKILYESSSMPAGAQGLRELLAGTETAADDAASK